MITKGRWLAASETADGTAVTGSVDVSLTWLDPHDPAQIDSFPGPFGGIREDNSEVLFHTYGSINIEITQDGELLDLADGAVAELQFPVVDGSAPSTIPLWYLDEELGEWFEEGSATLVGTAGAGGVYVGDVSHFTEWSPNDPMEVTCVYGCVTDAAGDPITTGRARADGCCDGDICRAECLSGWHCSAVTHECVEDAADCGPANCTTCCLNPFDCWVDDDDPDHTAADLCAEAGGTCQFCSDIQTCNDSFSCVQGCEGEICETPDPPYCDELVLVVPVAPGAAPPARSWATP